MKIATSSLILLLFLFTSCEEKASSSASDSAPEALTETATAPEGGILASVSVEEFSRRMMDDDVTLVVDVRTPPERERDGIIAPEGIEVAHWDFSGPNFQEQLKSIGPDQHVYVYCASGGRSARAGRMLTEHGVKEVYNLLGGITAWKAAGKETQSP